MSKYNFDEIINRKNTDSYKWDNEGESLGRNDIIPMWVADMDFACAPPIVEALKKRLEHPIFGYSIRREHFINSVVGWLKKRHDCNVKPEWIIFAPPGVIYAIYAMVRLLTEKGDGIILHMPNYDPLFELVQKSGRKLVKTSLKLVDGQFEMDFDDIERKIVENRPKLFIMSSPHNPTGRVWRKDELLRVTELCLKNNIYLIVDEIHADFVSKEVGFTSCASLEFRLLENMMICFSANKGFNLGGLQMSSIVIASKEKRKLLKEEISIAQTTLDTPFGIVATETAYSNPECEVWLDQAIEYVEDNKKFAEEYLKKNCPKIKMIRSQGTYLTWLNCEDLPIRGEELKHFMIKEAGVVFCAGYEFGDEGDAYLRMNVACPRKLLEKVLERITDAVKRSL